MRVLYDNQVFVTQRYGGVSRIFYQLIRHLAGFEQIDIALFHGFYINRYPLWLLKDKMAYYFGQEIPRIPLGAKATRVLNTRLFQHFAPGRGVDVFHPTDYSPPVYKWKKSPVVLTVCDMIPELFPGSFRDHAARVELKRKCIQRADHIITISHAGKRDLLRIYPIDERKVTPIHLGGANPIPFCDTQLASGPRLPEKPFILYVGTRKQDYKNFKTLLAAYAANTRVNSQFNLVCFGGPPFTPQEQEKIRGLGCGDKLFHQGGDDLLLAKYYSRAALFVYPSLYEGFGLPPLEAMCYKCPVIAGNVSSVPEVLGDAAVYFDPTEIESLSFQMESVIFDESKKEELITKGRIQAKKYSWHKMAEETLQVYGSVADDCLRRLSEGQGKAPLGTPMAPSGQ
ncbi:MAG: glycosyltransferase family 4 protein [bacterium]|nr:glycosyltransferase family 4 protein [bacterium]